MTGTKKALIIGGHGRVAQWATPKLAAAGFAVTSLIRDPAQSAAIERLGATPLVRDVTDIGPSEWDDILGAFYVAIWCAGNGGRQGPDATYAVDRDAPLATIDSLERLGADGPRYVMVSYIGSINHTVAPDDSFYPYAASKKAADDRLLGSAGLNYVILAPATLTDEPARGVRIIDNERPATAGDNTSRELVADVIVELARRQRPPESKIVTFVDGDGPVSGI